jgi:hypothetical protein
LNEQHTAIFLYNLVDDEHTRRRPISQVFPSDHLSKRRGSTDRKHVHLHVVGRERWGVPLVIKERFLNCMSRPCDMQLFIDWAIARIGDGKAHRAIGA